MKKQKLIALIVGAIRFASAVDTVVQVADEHVRLNLVRADFIIFVTLFFFQCNWLIIAFRNL